MSFAKDDERRDSRREESQYMNVVTVHDESQEIAPKRELVPASMKESLID
jgi:hypothetical protein